LELSKINGNVAFVNTICGAVCKEKT